MNLPLTPRDAELLARMSDRQLRAFLAKCSARGLLMLDAAYELWAAKGQIEPRGSGWRTWLMMAGRGYGKTRAGAEWVHRLAMTGRRRIALVGATMDEARAIMVEGVSGVIAVARRHNVELVFEPSRNQIRWPSGAIAALYSGEKSDGLRGPEHDFAWCVGDRRPVDLRTGRGCAGCGAPGRRPLQGFCTEWRAEQVANSPATTERWRRGQSPGGASSNRWMGCAWSIALPGSNYCIVAGRGARAQPGRTRS